MPASNPKSSICLSPFNNLHSPFLILPPHLPLPFRPHQPCPLSPKPALRHRNHSPGPPDHLGIRSLQRQSRLDRPRCHLGPHIDGAASPENLVGVTQSSTWNQVDQSFEGTIKLYTTAPGLSIAAFLDDLLTEDPPPDINLPIVFYPIWEHAPISTSQQGACPERSEGTAGGEGVRRTIGITHIESIDLVFQFAADRRTFLD